MPALTGDQIKSIVSKFIPTSFLENPFIKSLLAGATAIGILVATPAFAPMGVVGATGWIIVYTVTGGTFSMDLLSKAWKAWKQMGDDDRKLVDENLERLKKAHDEGALTDEEYRAKVQEVLNATIRVRRAA